MIENDESIKESIDYALRGIENALRSIKKQKHKKSYISQDYIAEKTGRISQCLQELNSLEDREEIKRSA